MPKHLLREVQERISRLPRDLQSEVRELYNADSGRAKDGAYYLAQTIKMKDETEVEEHAAILRWHIGNFLDRACNAETDRDELILNGISAAYRLQRAVGPSPDHVEKMLMIARLPGLKDSTCLEALDAIPNLKGTTWTGIREQITRQSKWHAGQAAMHGSLASRLNGVLA